MQKNRFLRFRLLLLMKSKHVPPPPAIQRLRIAEGDPIAEGENPHTYMGAEAKTHSKLTQNGKSTMCKEE